MESILDASSTHTPFLKDSQTKQRERQKWRKEKKNQFCYYARFSQFVS